jgi:type IV secretory pathway VirB10-like protein
MRACPSLVIRLADHDPRTWRLGEQRRRRRQQQQQQQQQRRRRRKQQQQQQQQRQRRRRRKQQQQRRRRLTCQGRGRACELVLNPLPVLHLITTRHLHTTERNVADGPMQLIVTRLHVLDGRNAHVERVEGLVVSSARRSSSAAAAAAAAAEAAAAASSSSSAAAAAAAALPCEMKREVFPAQIMRYEILEKVVFWSFELQHFAVDHNAQRLS